MNRVTEVMSGIATCLSEQIKKANSPTPCFVGVLPGQVTVADYAGDCPDGPCGMAYVRLTTAYPSVGVGRINENTGNCASELGYEVEVGILRCIETPDDGQPPSTETMLQAAEQQHQDMLSILAALYCCEAVNSKDFIVSSYVPQGPMGGIYGGAFTVMLAV